MRKLLTVLLISFLAGSVVCAEDDTTANDWNELGKIQDAWDGQEVVTDDKFEKVIQQMTKRSKEKQEKRFKKKIGESIVPIDTNVSSLKEIAQDYPTLLVPTAIVSETGLITPGFYRVLAAESKTKDKTYTINFYQGNTLVGKLTAYETKEDFDAETINFAKIIYNEKDKQAKVVYGCLEYNLIANTYTK